MNLETRKCQNCRVEFTIEPEDFKFYDKIKVPPPTWCPQCRLQRRLMWRNERVLYNRKNDAPGSLESFISNYNPRVTIPVYDQAYWWSDKWNSLTYGMEYDFSRPFFTQFKELLSKVPVMNLTNLQSVNSEYCNFTYQVKNGYLNIASDINEDSAYVHHTIYSKNSFDLLSCKKMELCYGCIHTVQSYGSSHLWFSNQCVDSQFLYNCRNCQNCFGCVNQRNGKYQIFNKQYSKETYHAKLKEFDFGSHAGLQNILKQFQDLILKEPHRFASTIQVQNVSGDYINNAKNCKFCFDVEGPAEDNKYVLYGVPNLRDCYDGYGTGNGMEVAYEITSAGGNAQRLFFSPFAWTGDNYYYSHFCEGCSSIFGCAGLHSKSYCILNKQYTKEEYEKLVPRIIQHMNDMPYLDKKGRIYRYGEFFPPELSPFSYNETIAQEYFPLTKEEAIEKGYSWKDPEPRNYQIQIPNDQLPDHIKDAPDDIVNQIIECGHAQGSPSKTSGQTAGAVCNEQCTEAFKIIQPELDFLRKMSLPLPRLCPNCRHYQRIKQRNPLKLWHRKCQCAGAKSENGIYQNTADHLHHKKDEPCLNGFESTYAPERPEIVYCEQCYLKEVV